MRTLTMLEERDSSVMPSVLQRLQGAENPAALELPWTTLPDGAVGPAWHQALERWYLEQCVHGRWQRLFDAEERGQLAEVLATLPAGPIGVEIHWPHLAAVRKVARAARRYERAFGGTRRLNVTSHVGQILACYHLKLRWLLDPHQPETAALDAEGRRVQIKTRRQSVPPPSHPDRRLGRPPSPESYWTVLVQLDPDYCVEGIWRGETAALLERLAGRRQYLTLEDFMAVAEAAWPTPSRSAGQPSPRAEESEPAPDEAETLVPVA